MPDPARPLTHLKGSHEQAQGKSSYHLLGMVFWLDEIIFVLMMFSGPRFVGLPIMV